MVAASGDERRGPTGDGVPQNMREYDPEWAHAFVSGRMGQSCDHGAMLAAVRVPLLFTHHFRHVDEETGHLVGALSDVQAGAVRRLVEGAGQGFTYRSFPDLPHSMHGADPDGFAATVIAWATSS